MLNLFNHYTKNDESAKQVIALETPKFIKKQPSTQSRGDSSYYSIQFTDLYRAYDQSGLFYRTISKIRELALRQGFFIKQADDQVIKYLNLRFIELENSSDKSFYTTVRDLLNDYILYGNCFMYLNRDATNSSGKQHSLIRKKQLQPISAFFSVPPRFVSVSEDQKKFTISSDFYDQYLYGNVYSDEDIVTITASNNKTAKTIQRENLLHFKFEENGELFSRSFASRQLGTLIILSTLEDVIETMISEKQFFITVYTVGTETNPADDTQLEEIKNNLEYNPDEGILIIPGNHKIDIKNNSTLQDLKNYLEYFQQKFYKEINISPIGLGEGGQANRATADTQNQTTFDLVRDVTQSFQKQFNFYFLRQLMMESKFQQKIFDPDFQMPEIVFPEPDIDLKIKLENQQIYKFEHAAYTEDEMRKDIDKKIISDKERSKLRPNLYKENIENSSSKETNNKVKPQNQHNLQEEK